MDTNKLMIGDKVLVKVLSQIPDTFVVHTWTAEDYMRDMLQVKPIPLTEEILEKNGWEAFNGRYNIVRYRILTKEMALIIEPMKVESILGERWFWLSVNKRDGAVRPNMNYPFCYIHELQHALRLCGLDELADNFKVE